VASIRAASAGRDAAAPGPTGAAAAAAAAAAPAPTGKRGRQDGRHANEHAPVIYGTDLDGAPLKVEQPCENSCWLSALTIVCGTSLRYAPFESPTLLA
ncbi:MAG: hypothetical protein ACK52I_12905, partial [Pseudomonadota bacterium]